MTHELKTWCTFFPSILKGTKSFEIRKNDRNFKVGDELHLREWDPTAQRYTGRSVFRRVTYVTGWEQQNGFVVMGLVEISGIDVALAEAQPDIQPKTLGELAAQAWFESRARGLPAPIARDAVPDLAAVIDKALMDRVIDLGTVIAEDALHETKQVIKAAAKNSGVPHGDVFEQVTYELMSEQIP